MARFLFKTLKPFACGVSLALRAIFFGNLSIFCKQGCAWLGFASGGWGVVCVCEGEVAKLKGRRKIVSECMYT